MKFTQVSKQQSPRSMSLNLLGSKVYALAMSQMPMETTLLGAK